MATSTPSKKKAVVLPKLNEVQARARIKELIAALSVCDNGKRQATALVDDVLTQLTGKGLNYTTVREPALGNVFAKDKDIFVFSTGSFGSERLLINPFTGSKLAAPNHPFYQGVKTEELEKHGFKYVAADLKSVGNLK